MTLDRSRTESLCPACLKRLPARRVQEGEAVYLEKTCPDHGPFRTRIWKGSPAFHHWRLPKIPVPPPVVTRGIDQGCPYDCGLCPDHHQRSCTILIEVTRRCDLTCAVCYAAARPEGEEPSLEVIRRWYRQAREGGGNCNIQLSGGEPTVRDDLPAIIALGRESGYPFIQLNTNGLRLARDRTYLKALKQAGLASVFLQFDGTDDQVYRRLRGRSLLQEKLDAVAACGEQDIGVVLVPTLVPGVNVDQVGAILQMALKYSPVVRGVHFQPISYFGRFPGPPDDHQRLTLPELMEAVEIQSKGLFRKNHFRPPGCENALCSFHGHYLIQPDGTVQSLQKPFDPKQDQDGIPADEGAARATGYVARQWSAASSENRDPENHEGHTGDPDDKSGPCCPDPGLITLDDFLFRARQNLFSLSAMAFQDVWNLTLDRIRDCCIHVLSPKGRLVPFCLYNLTARDGRTLYRDQGC